MKSTKVWVIAIEVMKTTKYKPGIKNKKETDAETSKAPIRFMWIPGMRPVKVPARIPRRRKRRISISIEIYYL